MFDRYFNALDVIDVLIFIFSVIFLTNSVVIGLVLVKSFSAVKLIEFGWWIMLTGSMMMLGDVKVRGE